MLPGPIAAITAGGQQHHLPSPQLQGRRQGQMLVPPAMPSPGRQAHRRLPAPHMHPARRRPGQPTPQTAPHHLGLSRQRSRMTIHPPTPPPGRLHDGMQGIPRPGQQVVPHRRRGQHHFPTTAQTLQPWRQTVRQRRTFSKQRAGSDIGKTITGNIGEITGPYRRRSQGSRQSPPFETRQAPPHCIHRGDGQPAGQQPGVGPRQIRRRNACCRTLHQTGGTTGDQHHPSPGRRGSGQERQQRLPGRQAGFPRHGMIPPIPLPPRRRLPQWSIFARPHPKRHPDPPSQGLPCPLGQKGRCLSQNDQAHRPSIRYPPQCLMGHPPPMHRPQCLFPQRQGFVTQRQKGVARYSH